MSKAPMDTIQDRFQKRSLSNLLVRKFLTEYGYDHGPVIAQAIVEDILTTVEQCYPERLAPKTVVWLAVRREWRGQRKGLDLSHLVTVQLQVVNEKEIELLMSPTLRRESKASRAFNRERYARWCFDAYEQGGVLTLLDLSLISGLSEHYVGELLREYETQTGKVVPTRGTIHDMGRSVTHKAEVVRRWLRHESPAQIARDLNHSQPAVDRYIADFRKVRLLAQKIPPAELPSLTGLSKSVVGQYLDLLDEYEPALVLYPQTGNGVVPASSETMPDAQPVSRAESEASLDTGEHQATVERQQEQRPSVGH